MDTPESMASELAAWNDGGGIDLKTWVGCMGNFSLAVGYATVFWPEFVEFEDYILPGGFRMEHLRGFERHEGSTRRSVEWAMNHIPLHSVQHVGCEDLSADKLVALGYVLKEIYSAKLAWQFPHRPCRVEFTIPDNPEHLDLYEVSFWQRIHEPDPSGR